MSRGMTYYCRLEDDNENQGDTLRSDTGSKCIEMMAVLDQLNALELDGSATMPDYDLVQDRRISNFSRYLQNCVTESTISQLLLLLRKMGPTTIAGRTLSWPPTGRFDVK